MKRFIAVLSGLLVLPAFAEVAPAYFYEDVAEYATENAPVADDADAVAATEKDTAAVAPSVPSLQSPRTATGRAMPANYYSNNGPSTRDTSVAARTVTARTTSSAPVATATTSARASLSRAAATNTASRSVSAKNDGALTVSARRSAPATNPVAARASIVQTDTVNSPLYTGRVGVRSSSSMISRAPTVTVSNTATTTTTTATDMDELAQITDFCKAQYTDCMDNFCNVLDDNQGRCSCSASIDNYAETETSLKQATEDLQVIAQQIQYIGLTSDEVETLFTQTEAESAMQSTTDSTQLKNDLDSIKKLIINPKSANPTTTSIDSTMDMSGLLDFSFSSSGFDLGTMFGTSTGTASSISNQRGATLYKTAAARCKAAVLNDCKAQGVDTTVVSNSYDLAIDKHCVAYERNLSDSTDQMGTMVVNAKSVLQKARLLVAQQKNSYDLRGCISALDSCMQDDFVCGNDYENCVDPTGKYILNGEIIVGSTPGTLAGATEGTGLYESWETPNPWASDGTVAKYIEATLATKAPTANSTDMSTYLQSKIGYNDGDKNQGMCMSVLNKCQDYTYDDNNKFKFGNSVINEYLQRTLIQIKVAQDNILSEYAETCISDVTSCLSSNAYSIDASATLKNVAMQACDAIITTCRSTNGEYTDKNGNADWVEKLYSTDDSTSANAGSTTIDENCGETVKNCITNAAGYDTELYSDEPPNLAIMQGLETTCEIAPTACYEYLKDNAGEAYPFNDWIDSKLLK